MSEVKKPMTKRTVSVVDFKKRLEVSECRIDELNKLTELLNKKLDIINDYSERFTCGQKKVNDQTFKTFKALEDYMDHSWSRKIKNFFGF